MCALYAGWKLKPLGKTEINREQLECNILITVQWPKGKAQILYQSDFVVFIPIYGEQIYLNFCVASTDS
jgi:hypothetical protein